MKNTNLEKIYNKLPKEEKTELAKVELSFASDLKQSLKDIKVLVKEAVKISDRIEKFSEQTRAMRDKLTIEAKKGVGVSNGLFKLTDSGKKLLERVEKAAKELGVSPDNIQGYKEFKEIRAQAYFDAKNAGSGEFDVKEFGGKM